VKVISPAAISTRRWLRASPGPAASSSGCLARRSEGEMSIRMNRNQIQLLNELASSGQRGRITALASSVEIAHLIGAPYIRRLPRTNLYMITEHGRRALVDAAAEQG
jgi:hypothetical protein